VTVWFTHCLRRFGAQQAAGDTEQDVRHIGAVEAACGDEDEGSAAVPLECREALPTVVDERPRG